MKTTTALLLIFLIISSSCDENSSNTSMRPSILRLADAIEETNVLYGVQTVYPGKNTLAWLLYEKLSDEATDAELIQLTDHSNVMVRCYAFKVLIDRETIDFFGTENTDFARIVRKHTADTAEIEIGRGCMIYYQQVGDYFRERVSSLPRGSLWHRLTSQR